jgi:pyridoxine 4-dehydrogenase
VLDSAKALGGVKKIDLFKPAHLDRVYSVEEVTQSLKTLVDKGLISYIGLSEVNADMLCRACKVMDIPISASQRADQVKHMIGYSNSHHRD